VNPEFEKIETFFADARTLWETDPEMAISRQYFEMWQLATQPQPFIIEADTFELAGDTFRTGAEEESCIGYFGWESSEDCVKFTLEGPGTEKTLLMPFNDGVPAIIEQPLVFVEDDELTLGERLEVMYEVVAYVRKHEPARDVRDLNRTEVASVLDAVADSYEPRAIRIMKRLKLASLRRMLDQVVSDMAVDELSNQLEFPLDGSYAATAANEPDSGDIFEAELAPIVGLPARTIWDVMADLVFIQSADIALLELEEVFVLQFNECEVLQQVDRRMFVLRLPTPPDLPLTEGNRVRVYMRGEHAFIATFRIDLLERDHVYGRFQWRDVPDAELPNPRIYGRPQPGPTKFISGLVNAMVVEYQQKSTFEAPALNAALGIHESGFVDDRGADADLVLDTSQRHAWANAVSEENPIVVIQGPPGTGKTYVLEQVVRTLCGRGMRLLVAAPSNTAVDNVCRRVLDLPVLRVGRERDNISTDVADGVWIQNLDAVAAYKKKRTKCKGSVYAGTHFAILRDDVIQADREQNGPFDCIIFDESGMARMDEFLLCLKQAKRAVLFGDHQQLPPFPLPSMVAERLKGRGPVPRSLWAILSKSALEWLGASRNFPVFMLEASYRCQNPRLMRFSSTLFYNARVKASESAEYYQLDFETRHKRFPTSTLRFYRTSELPARVRREQLVIEGHKPGLQNPLEARLCVCVFCELIRRYPLDEVTIIAPYRRQVRLIRQFMTYDFVKGLVPSLECQPDEWDAFLRSRISTVDSFQGGESDVVIICYVRSNAGEGIGFIDNSNRINVAHTRARREMVVVGDLDNLKEQAKSRLFERMERAIRRDGEIVNVTKKLSDKLKRIMPDPSQAVAAYTVAGIAIKEDST
jgi:hypothetical protein